MKKYITAIAIIYFTVLSVNLKAKFSFVGRDLIPDACEAAWNAIALLILNL